MDPMNSTSALADTTQRRLIRHQISHSRTDPIEDSVDLDTWYDVRVCAMQRNPLIKVLLACLLFGLCCKRSRRRSGQQLMMMMMMMMIAHAYLCIEPYNDVQQVTVVGVILPIWVSEYGYSAATTSWVGSLPSLFQLAFGIIVG